METAGSGICHDDTLPSTIEWQSCLTSDEDDTEEEEGLLIPTYQDLLLHVVLRHVHDLQHSLLLNHTSPAQHEQLLLANLALQHLPSNNNLSLRTHCKSF